MVGKSDFNENTVVSLDLDLGFVNRIFLVILSVVLVRETIELITCSGKNKREELENRIRKMFIMTAFVSLSRLLQTVDLY